MMGGRVVAPIIATDAIIQCAAAAQQLLALLLCDEHSSSGEGLGQVCRPSLVATMILMYIHVLV